MKESFCAVLELVEKVCLQLEDFTIFQISNKQRNNQKPPAQAACNPAFFGKLLVQGFHIPQERFVRGCVGKKIFGYGLVIPERSIRQPPQIPPRLVFKLAGNIASRLNEIVDCILRLLSPSVEIWTMSAAKNIHPSGTAAIDQRHGSPTPELAVEFCKIVIRPCAVEGSVIKYQRFGDAGATVATAEERS